MKLQRRCLIFRSFQTHSTFPVTAWTHWRHRRPRARSVELFQPLLELTDVLARDQLLKQGQFFSYFILFLWWQTAIVTACAQPNLRQVQNLDLGCLYRRLGNHNNCYHGLGGHNKQHASVNLLLLIYYCIHTTMATTLSCACEPYTKNRKPVNCGNVANLTSGYTR